MRDAVFSLRLAAVVVALLGAGCTEMLDNRADLQLTWEKAVVALPQVSAGKPKLTTMESPEVASHLARYDPGVKLPLVLYMHGCTGIGNFEFFKRLARAGFAVIAPDSLARRFRPLQCDPKTKTGGYNLFVYDLRLAEISYALHRMSNLSWIDFDNLFLVGTSEGGVATAHYRGEEFRAHVISQWTCNGAHRVRGLAMPAATPVLAIVSADDPWYGPERTPDQEGHCGQFLGDRPDSASFVLPPGSGHDVFDDAAAIETIVQFLVRQTRRR
jgi:dienelactone hydrolase